VTGRSCIPSFSERYNLISPVLNLSPMARQALPSSHEEMKRHASCFGAKQEERVLGYLEPLCGKSFSLGLRVVSSVEVMKPSLMAHAVGDNIEIVGWSFCP
jgi:hypothetical protein